MQKLTTGNSLVEGIYNAIVHTLLQNDLEVGAYYILVNDGSIIVPEEINIDDLVPASDVVIHVYFAHDNVDSGAQE